MIMKKRKSPLPHNATVDSEDSELEIVDAEEKVEPMDEESEDENEDDDEEEPTRSEGSTSRTAEESAFMDAFYGLSSSNPAERAQAANVLLHHCLVGPEANTKDAAYALRRLLNGLCSGRAASRQGNASALASFLKLALEGGQLHEIREQDESTTSTANVLDYVRQRLLKATDPSATEGKKKRSEERDYQFGRLFGVLSVSRSGILLPNTNNNQCDVDEIMNVSAGLVSDLVELYSQKKWMREPAAHAIGTILNVFYAAASEDDDALKVARHLVEEVVTPQLFTNEDHGVTMDEFSAEKIAIAANIQCYAQYHAEDGFPSELAKPIFSSETLPMIAKTLAETSTVTVPRTHLVWDALWNYLTEPQTQASTMKKDDKSDFKVAVRTIREKPVLGDDSTRDIIQSVIRHVILEGLLKVDGQEGAGKVTHEKRALALCVIRNLLGVPFNSSIAGPTRIEAQAEDVEQMLTPVIIRRLFLDIICAGGGGSKTAHILKPLALQILESIVGTLKGDNSEMGFQKRVAIAQNIIRCEPRFDARTKTTTIADLVGLGDDVADTLETTRLSAMRKHFESLESQIVYLASRTTRTSSEMEINEATRDLLASIDLLFQTTKRLLRLTDDDNTELEEFKSSTVKAILAFFMSNAFFNCDKLELPHTSGSEKKKKKGKGKDKAKPTTHQVVTTAMRCKQLKKDNECDAVLPYEARLILSERFYSLLAEYINVSLYLGSGSRAKTSKMLDIVADICHGWKSLESAGAKPLFNAINSARDDTNDDGETETENPDMIVTQLQSLANDVTTSSQDSDDPEVKARRRCATSCAALASVLFLHLLGCGRPEDIMDEDEITTEDDDDSADIVDAIREIGELTPIFLDSSVNTEQNPLAGFADVCIAILSGRLASGVSGRGASPRLLREAIKFAWTGALSVSATAKRSYLDEEVVSVLMNGIGASMATGLEEDADVDDDESGSDSENGGDDDESSDQDLADFSKVGNILDADDEADKREHPEVQDTEGGEEEVEIDSERLNSLLEQDSDDEIDEGGLEHHEGADAALAAMIKLKQESRKAGQKARERLDIENQLRCTLLIETLLGKSEGWNSLYRSDIILQMALPLLAYRNQVDNSLSRATEKANRAESSSKVALLERLTSILKSKLFKLKFSTMPMSESVEKLDFFTNFASAIMELAHKKCSKDQRGCCSLGLVTVIKALHDSEDALKVSSLYETAVEEWSTKRTSRLEASIFEDLVHHCPSVAQATLLLPLSSAAKSARSPFLRCECFRLLSILLNPKLNPQSSDFDAAVVKKTHESLDQVATAFSESLKDDEMQKAKRVREVLKATEKFLIYAKSCLLKLSNIGDLKEAIAHLESESENPGVKALIQKLHPLLNELDKPSSSNATGEEDQDMEEEKEIDNKEPNENKSNKKKKKKKKKKGKR